MARGTYFGGLHSNRDLGLIQQSVEVQPAQPKLNIIDIPGANGSKDLSAYPGGGVVFADREIVWTFAVYPGGRWYDHQRKVSNALNGLACYITLDEDPGYYYVGRLSVDSYHRDQSLRQITIRANCRPFKLKKEVTTITAALTTTAQTFELRNDRKPVVPTITVTAETTLEWNGGSYTISAGTHKILDIQFTEGDNELRAKVTSGTGSITITYQEGAL